MEGRTKLEFQIEDGETPTAFPASKSTDELLGELDYSQATKRPQIIAAFCATLGATALGTIIAYSSPVIPELESCDEVCLSDSQESWFGSLVPLGCLFGALSGGTQNRFFGKKRTLLICAIPFLVGWILVIIGQNVGIMFLGRFLGGFAGGTVSMAAPTYIADISQPSIRGALGSGFQLMVVTGIWLGATFSLGLSWRWLAGVSAAFPLAMAVCLYFMPESPLDHLEKGENEKAEAALLWFRGPEHDVKRELDEMERQLRIAQSQKVNLKHLKNRVVLLPLGIGLALMLFQQFSGINAVMFYTEQIFAAANTGLSNEHSAVIVLAAQVLATAASALLVDRYGRKFLLAISDATMTVALVVMGTYFYIQEGKEDLVLAEKLGAIPILSLVLFCVGFSIGYGPIPWLIMSELFAPEVRGAASSIATGLNWTSAFIITFTFASLKAGIGSYGTFWLYAGVCAAGTAFIILFVPETKEKPFAEIQKLFSRE